MSYAVFRIVERDVIVQEYDLKYTFSVVADV